MLKPSLLPRMLGERALDGQRLKDSFARVAMHGDAMPLFFFSDLFLRHPECRDLFPVSMAVMRTGSCVPWPRSSPGWTCARPPGPAPGVILS
jgi:hypothetical protein